MIRFAWLQARAQTTVAVAALAAAAVIAAITGPRLLHLYDVNVASCQGPSACGSATATFLASYRWMQVFAPPLLLVLPALIGMFWGAPLIARELETGTFRMAWTQSVTRQRWLAVKLVLIGLTSMAVTGLLSLILTWWFSPIDRVQPNPLDPSIFGVRGIAPVGYAAFAFALGVTAGALLRRTIPAMAVTLAGFTAARMAVTYYVRPYIFAPLRVVSPLVMGTGNGAPPQPGAGTVKPGDLVLSTQTINGSGQVIGQNGGVGANGDIGFSVLNGKVSLHGVGPCPNAFPADALARATARTASQPPAAFNAAAQECINKLGIREVVTYQPLGHYWPLQWLETLIFLGLAIALAGLCFWRIRRSLT
jgi:hypothetical protein